MPYENYIGDTYYFDRRKNIASLILIFLLIPLFFFVGWVASDYYNNGHLGPANPEFGIGGAPADQEEMISPLPSNVSPIVPSGTTAS
ncbi:hypothetical protein HY407_01140 [Candidatus Gottesmanbacteria bacterium]|nr:hypothetical protein [Candidatus Gottesmanbacteria bacterium]